MIVEELGVTEELLEVEWLQFGTAKKKADLLKRTGVSPNKIRHALKKFGFPVPGKLIEAEEFTADFFDFLLDFDGSYYEQFPERSIFDDIFDYIRGEIWIQKHKKRYILIPTAMVALDIRKCLKDHASNIAQIAGRIVKNVGEGLPEPTKKELRSLFIESADEVAEISFGALLKKIKLLPE